MKPPPGPLEQTIGSAAAIRAALADPKIADWVGRYRHHTERAERSSDAQLWTVHVDSPVGGEIARAEVELSGRVRHAWTGPQVAWKMARGAKGAFGRKLNDWRVWTGFCLVFALALVNWRRVLSLRTLDVAGMLSLSISLAYFNQGLVFWSVPLAYPPLLYLLARLTWIGLRGSSRSLYTGVLPVWLLAGLAVFGVGFRLGLNAFDSSVIDVGYAGTIGADRLVSGQVPYGTFPSNRGAACGLHVADGSSTAYRQPTQSDRCETPNARGDTYGPITYAAYVPALALVGWTGRWDTLPSAHLTTIAFDLLCVLGLVAIGLRRGGARLAALLALCWVAYPFTTYSMQSNSNDMIITASLIWGFAAASQPFRRGFALGLATWCKFAPLVLWPLWLRGSSRARAAAGMLAATVLALALVLPGGISALHRAWDSTFGWQLNRPSPFSLWDWGIYPGFPDLGFVQTGLKVTLAIAAIVVCFRPRVVDSVRLAALSGALLIGFQLTLTHWSYLYVEWFAPFCLLAFCLASDGELAIDHDRLGGAVVAQTIDADLRAADHHVLVDGARVAGG